MYSVPAHLKNYIKPEQRVEFKGGTLMHSCSHESVLEGEALNTAHQLLWVNHGVLLIESASQPSVSVSSGDAIIIRKGTHYRYVKNRDNNKQYQSVLFFIDDQYLRSFVERHAALLKPEIKSTKVVSAIQNNPYMKGFGKSMLEYFDSGLQFDDEFLELKTNELLFLLFKEDPSLLTSLIGKSQQGKIHLQQIMEANYLNNALGLMELALLSGRSLATFKRDFQDLYQVSPAKWLKHRRLQHAKHLLFSTRMTVLDVALASGFQDHSHFSREFKSVYGHSPKVSKIELHSTEI